MSKGGKIVLKPRIDEPQMPKWLQYALLGIFIILLSAVGLGWLLTILKVKI